MTLALRKDAGQLRLTVCDDGPGIAPEEREAVFKRFYRVLGNRDSEGSGLGLCIVREIVLAHGGAVQLSDAPGGRGLCVDLALPADG